MGVDAPTAALPVELAKLKLPMLSKEGCRYDVPYMNMTVGSYSMLVDKLSTNLTVHSS